MSTLHIGIKLTVTGATDEQAARALADEALQAFATKHSLVSVATGTSRDSDYTGAGNGGKVTVDVFSQLATNEPPV